MTLDVCMESAGQKKAQISEGEKQEEEKNHM